MKKFHFLLNPFVILFFINFIFFFPLFFPHLKLIITPEYGGGDENIFHYPIKYLFQQKIKQGSFLLWSNKISGGYPVFALSELGFLNPINYFTLRFLSFTQAINLQIFIYFQILLYSTYFLGRVFQLSKTVSVFYSVVFSYCFYNIANIIHLSHIASFCYIPVIFALIVLFVQREKSNIKYIISLIIVLVLQILSGHQQYFYYSLLIIILYLLINYFLYKTKRKQLLKKAFLIVIIFVFVVLLALPQILPTLEYLRYANNRFFNSPRSLGLVNILTFFNPFILYRSDLKNAASGHNYIPPWDSNFYFGILPIIVFILLLLKSGLKKVKLFIKNNREIIVLLFIFFLMVFGKNSPIYFIYDLWPFVLFRSPERITFNLLLIVILIIFLLFNNFWKSFNKKIKLFFCLIICINFIFSIYLMYSFHLLVDDEILFSKSKIIKNFKKTNNRILSLSFYENMNSYLLNERGIKNKIFSNLILIKNSLTQNLSLLFNIQNYNLPSSALNLNRHHYFYNYLFDDEGKASMSALTKSLLEISDIGYLITPYKLNENNYLTLLKKIDKENLSFYYYQTIKKPNRVYFSNKIKKISTLDEFIKSIEENNHIITVEKELPLFKTNQVKPVFEYKITEDKDYKIIINVISNTDGIMVLADNYYPGWQAFVDGKQTEIIRANFSFRGIKIPAGSHRIEFRYKSEKFIQGLQISFFMLILIIIGCAIFFNNKKLKYLLA